MAMDEDTTEDRTVPAPATAMYPYEQSQNRANALMYAANSFGSQATEGGLDVDEVLARARKFEAYLNGETPTP